MHGSPKCSTFMRSATEFITTKWQLMRPLTNLVSKYPLTTGSLLLMLACFSIFAEKRYSCSHDILQGKLPDATILPKMHILEDHVVPWMRRWHIGAGLMGEQEAESIHAHFHRLENQYSGIVNPLDKLRYIVNEHNIETTPGLNCLRPTAKVYKKRPRDD